METEKLVATRPLKLVWNADLAEPEKTFLGMDPTRGQALPCWITLDAMRMAGKGLTREQMAYWYGALEKLADDFPGRRCLPPPTGTDLSPAELRFLCDLRSEKQRPAASRR